MGGPLDWHESHCYSSEERERGEEERKMQQRTVHSAHCSKGKTNGYINFCLLVTYAAFSYALESREVILLRETFSVDCSLGIFNLSLCI